MGEDIENSDMHTEIVFQNEIKKKLLNTYNDYRKTILHLSCDVPIESLCLSKSTENILLNNGIRRVHEILSLDFTKIKGLGSVRGGELAASLEKFIPMGI